MRRRHRPAHGVGMLEALIMAAVLAMGSVAITQWLVHTQQAALRLGQEALAQQLADDLLECLHWDAAACGPDEVTVLGVVYTRSVQDTPLGERGLVREVTVRWRTPGREDGSGNEAQWRWRTGVATRESWRGTP